LKSVTFYDLADQNNRLTMSYTDKLVEYIVALRRFEKPKLYQLLAKGTRLFSELVSAINGADSSDSN